MSKKIIGYALGAAILIIAISLAVYRPPSHTTNTGALNSAAVSTNKFTLQNYMFAPMAIKVKVGTTVTWVNQDQVHHSVTADTVSSDAPKSPLLGQGETYNFTFHKAGTYAFHCMPHPYMHGTVIVTN